MKINALNTFPLQYNCSLNKNNKKVSFGDNCYERAIQEQHQRYIPKLDKVVTKAIKERPFDDIKLSITLLTLAQSFNEKINKSDASFHLMESVKMEMISLYNSAICNIVGEPFDLWNNANEYGFFINKKPDLINMGDGKETEVLIKNIEYLKNQLEIGIDSGN